MSSFIHLRNHSQYSILDATPSIKDLVKKCQNLQMESVALTDHANLFGAVEFYKECQDQGIKPIIGTELYVAPTNHTEKRKLPGMRAAYNLTLLAKNNQGYKNLCKLSSLGYLQGFYYFPRVDIELLEQYKEGVIAIFGGMGSLLAHQLQQEGEEAADQCLDSYLKIYQGSLYLDLQRHQMSEEQILADKMTSESWLVQAYREYNQKQQKLNEYLINISHKKNVPIVATNDVHYLDREDWRSHEVLLNIGSGEPCEIWEKNSQGILQFKIPNPKRSTYASHEHYFKTEAEMQTLFADQPASLNNTKAISDLCHVEIDFKTKHYPIFIPPKLEQQTYSKEEQKKSGRRVSLAAMPRWYQQKV